MIAEEERMKREYEQQHIKSDLKNKGRDVTCFLGNHATIVTYSMTLES